MSTTDLNLEDIITKFELQVNDVTELSSQEETDLANDKYMDICMERQWMFLKKSATGALAYDNAAGMYYITKPEDFSMFVENNEYTENTMPINNNAVPRVIFVGANYAPVQVINFSDRIQYRNQNNVAYLDPVANKIYFPKAPADTSFYIFDYIHTPPLLEDLTDTPIFPSRFRKMIWFAMATDNDILQLSAKANSYAADNRGKYQDTLEKMEFWDANQYNN